MTGSTSDIGRVIADKITSAGYDVARVSRADGISIDDKAALSKAFKGAEGAYIMIPFDMLAEDLHQRENEIGAKLAEVLGEYKVRRVVLLSGPSAYLKSGSSLGAALMEERLNTLKIPELVHLRCGFFMENFIKGLGIIQQSVSGIFSTAFRGDFATPMIATRDIGEIAATILLKETFNEPIVRELLGPRDYTFEEATQIFGTVLGHSDLVYRQASYEDAVNGMLSAGLSASFVDAIMETAASFNRRDQWSLEKRSESNTTPTTLEAFAREKLSKF